jgi:hypothetical protein
MAVTGVHAFERHHSLDQIERLVSSRTLHGSESLCKLLRYLADHAMEHPGVPVKEYQLATEVFGRPAAFDPHLDSTIRVQAGRLRAKLAEYYASEGADDPVLVEMPKGTYLLSFHTRPIHEGSEHSAVPHPKNVEEIASAPFRKWAFVVLGLSVLLAAAVAAIVVLITTRTAPAPVSVAHVEPAPVVFQIFWKDFISSPDEEPWVIFSNGAFVGRPETGMRYFNPAKDSRDQILDHYTGVGEVLAVHELDRVFELLGHRLRVKRGSLFSLDDAQNNNLIFVGSPAENLTLRDIPNTRNFVFRRLTSGPRKGDLAIVNLRPQPGEQKEFLGSATRPLTEDYAVIGLVPGLNPARSVMIFAGTTTLGTQAAVEYACRPSSLEELLLRLSVSQVGDLTPFEAVLRVKVALGVPVGAELVAVRKSNLVAKISAQ